MKDFVHSKALLSIIIICFLSSVGILAGAVLLTPDKGAFYADGYVNDFNRRLSDKDGEETETQTVVNQVRFSQSTPISGSYFDHVRFKNTDGEKVQVKIDRFVHYIDGSLSSIGGMLLTDLDNFTEGVYDIYYLTDMMVLTKAPEGYTIDNNQSELDFQEFLLKSSDDCYIAVSPKLTLNFPGGSEVVIDDGQIEIQFLEEYIAAVATPEDSYRFLTQGATITFQNGTVLDMSTMELLNHKRSASDGDDSLEALKADADLRTIALKELEVDSEDSIALQSVTEFSWVMPTFVVDPVDGTDGIDGEDGTDGSAGADGTAGAEGTAGSNGASGADGSSGHAGASGGAGKDGTDGNKGNGSSAVIDTDVEKFPRVSITDWNQTAGSLSISLKTYEQDTLVEGSSKISIYNPSTGETIYQWTADNGLELKNASGEEEPPEITFDYDMLAPNTSYRLIVEAQVKRALGESGESATGNYILTSRTFRTDAAGFHLKLAGRREDAFEFAPVISSNRKVEEFQGLTLTPVDGGEPVCCSVEQLSKLTESVNGGSCLVNGLRSNTTYKVSALVKFSDVKTPVTYNYEYQTLKKIPVAVDDTNGNYTGYTLTASDYRYFIASAGKLVDEDNAVEYYNYELYEFQGTGNEQSVDTSSAFYGSACRIRESSEAVLPIYLDESRKIFSGPNRFYSLKVSYTYYDNEKYVTVYFPYPKERTEFENRIVANIPSTEVPYIQYIRTGNGITVNGIEGWLEVDPSNSGELYVEDSDLHYLTVTVSSANSTRQYTYNDLKEWKRKDGTSPHGTAVLTEAIRLPMNDWTVKAGTTYTITVNGFIVMDGKDEAPQYRTLGSIVFTTPKAPAAPTP